jgi:hypothetical protein
MTQAKRNRPAGGLIGVIVVGCVVGVLLALFVAMGVTRREPPAYTPTPIAPRPADGQLVGPAVVTVDASTSDRWRFFSFDHGTVIERPAPRDWDIAFRRFQVIVNAGTGFAGDGGVIDLGDVAFDAVAGVPADGYVVNTVRSDTVNAVLRKWYDYSFLSHLLSPKPRVFAVRTADGRFAKLEFIGYYCPGAVPGCVTFRYAYQGGGGVDFVGRDAPE